MIFFSQAGVAFAAIFLSIIVYTVMKGHPVRKYVDQMRQRGLPMPKWNWLIGHSLVAKDAVEKLPGDAIIDNMVTAVSRKFPDTDMFYLDFWPLSVPMLVVTNPEAAIQANQVHNLDKPPLLHDLMMDPAGGSHMFMMAESQWKSWRKTFNAGFGEHYIFSLVPRIVEEVSKYSEMLRKRVRDNQIFSLDEVTLRLAFDLIGRTVLDSNLEYQSGPNSLADAMRSQIYWHSFGNKVSPWTRWHPVRPIIQRYNSWVMNRYIGQELDRRYAEKGNETVSDKTRSVISLVLYSYPKGLHSENDKNKVDRVFRRYATYQIRIFLFAGHDSTSTTICYYFYLLSKNPEALAPIRKEYDEILGHDLSGIAGRLSSDPTLLNKLPYTAAVIKETLRLFPPASSM